MLLTYYCAVGNALSGGGNSGFNNNGFNNNGNSYNACGKRRKRQVRGDSFKKHFQLYFEYVHTKKCLVVDRHKKTKSNEEAIIIMIA